MIVAKNAEKRRVPITLYWRAGLSTIRRSIETRDRGEEIFQEETRVVRMDSSVIDVLFTTARPGAVANKSLVGFIDITERKKAEEALHERKALSAIPRWNRSCAVAPASWGLRSE